MAAEISMLVGEMVKLGADLDNVWLVGHSLGAHTVGDVGKNTPGIGRITGLDPAEPYFEGERFSDRSLQVSVPYLEGEYFIFG